ncbi:hypothetical protein [Micromonospora sp. NBC_01813]|uniref:hypothetical protein n=1 Tax=Micromonospora sp. NBC_01813 TaxID=2975988 RepID=UPI002DDBB026|nr:hypothetical protein [Micromonospora sp. NBC_01813]WSA11751.1 hypothetical protein OG958_13730 [Micromonospora sp. NBC_01813]
MIGTPWVAFGRFKQATIGLVLLAALLATTACSGSTDERLVVFDEQIVPIIIEAGKAGAKALPPPYGQVVLVGIFAAEHLAEEHAKDQDVTYLLIEQAVDGEPQISVFRVDTNRRLKVAMNGSFVQEIERNRIKITVDPAVESTIVVTDALTEDVIEIDGDFRVYGNDKFDFGDSTKAHFDLDSGQHGDPDTDPAYAEVVDISMPDAGGFGANMRNGARIADWQSGTPSFAECSSLPEDRWKDRIQAGGGNFWKLRPTFCIRTSDGRYGLLSVKIDQSMRYVLWKSPGADPEQ